MGSVYRKTVTKPIPAGAEIIDRKGERVARWKQNGKTRTAALTIKGDRISIVASTFTAKFRDGSGTTREVATGCKDEMAAKSILADLERRAEHVKAGILKPEEASAVDHLHRPINQHIEKYLAHLQAAGVSVTHRENVERQLNRVFDDCGFKTLADLNKDKIVAWMNKREMEAKMGPRTRNTYLAAAIAFCNWCCDPVSPRLISNPFDRVPKADESANQKRKRRAMTEEELLKLLAVARKRPLLEALTIRTGKRKGELGAKVDEAVRERRERLGWERALIYKTLVLTGLRKNELATLQIGQLELDGALPFIQLDAADEKNREGNQIALRLDLVADLKAWLKDRAEREGKLSADTLLFRVPAGLIRILDRDLVHAGIPKRDERGRTLDVHALRHSFSTLLSKGGVAPRTAQAAMRHSDISLTMTTYTDEKLLNVREALNVLPALAICHDHQPNVVQTTTEQFAPLFALTADPTSQNGSTPDKMDKICGDAIEVAENHSANANSESPMSCDVLSSERAKGLEPSTSSLGS